MRNVIAMSQAASPTTSKLLAALEVASSALASDTSRRIAVVGVAAGAMAAAMPADATVVVQTINQFLPVNGATPITVALSPTLGLKFTAASITGIGSTLGQVGVAGTPFNGVAFGATSSQFAAPGGGLTFTQAYGGNGFLGATLASVHVTSSGKTTMPAPSGLQDYGFEFVSSTGTMDFGWFSGSNTSVDGVFGFYIQDVAVADDGNPVIIGTTQVASDVPEPASASLLLLGAMVTGAAGMRRFKRNRPAA
jgi:hypothetical protein